MERSIVMKKRICFLLMVLFTIFIFAACRNSAGNTLDKGTIVIGLPKGHFVSDLYNNEYTKWIEEQTGIHLEFLQYSEYANDHEWQIQTDISNDIRLPDILLGLDLSTDFYTGLGQRGYLQDLRQYIEDKNKSKSFWSRVDELRDNPLGVYDDLMDTMEAMLYSTDSAGNKVVYGLPSAELSFANSLDFMPFINTQWLERVDMDMPTNLEELLRVLMAFKNTDCNNNNLADEIPMVGCVYDDASGDAFAWLINCYLYCNDETGFNVDNNGNLYVPQITNDYRNALQYISQLWQSGLLQAQKSSVCKDKLKQKDCYGVIVGNPRDVFNNNDIIHRYQPLNLFGYTYYSAEKMNISTFITKDCKNVDAAWKVLMLMYTQEAAIRQRYGSPGEEWEYSEGNVATQFGQPAIIKVLKDTRYVDSNDNWKIRCGSFFTYEITEMVEYSQSDTWNATLQSLTAQQHLNYMAAYIKTAILVPQKNICPTLVFNGQEKSLTPDIEKLKIKMADWQVMFINGSKNVNKSADWNEYLKELNAAGLQNYLKAAQQCYDRMYPNGHVK